MSLLLLFAGGAGADVTVSGQTLTATPALVPGTASSATSTPAGHGKGRPRRLSSDVLPRIQRRGAPAAYAWRAEQIERNNQVATQIAQAVAKALTAKT